MMKSQVALLYVLIIMSEGSAQSLKPRRSVFFSDVNLKLFKEPDFDGLSSMLVREDIGLLFIGARGKVITLSLDDITEKTSETEWMVSSGEKSECIVKGKSIQDCENYITTLHTLNDGRIFTCGTRAFKPLCTHLLFKGGNVTMETTTQDGRGRAPFNPHEEFATMMNENTLYSAVSVDFMGKRNIFLKTGRNYLSTEDKTSWFNDPIMISINVAEIRKSSKNKDDDNLFVFFTETAVEERRSNLRLSRIARVCKSDLGGFIISEKKWTSFLKARLDCPFGDTGSLSLVQDVFFVKDKNNATESLFYATFASSPEPSSTCSQSAVCAYKVSDIQQVFRGNLLDEIIPGGWVKYMGKENFAYPRSCINDEMRANGVKTSFNIPENVLLFAKNHPLMEGAVTPITGRPLLVWSAAQFSRIVVDKVTSLDGQQHIIMLISNNSGWLQKVVWSENDGGRIIEELQLFQDPQPIRFLQLSSRSGQLYSATRTAVAQLSVRDCSRYTSCDDCLIARDPYCGWDHLRGLCAAVAGASNSSMIQNLIDGDVEICPSFNLSKQITDIHLTVDVAQFLPCSPDTNLPVSWRFSGSILEPGPRHILLSQGLVLTPSSTDEGLYTCETVEVVKGREHRKVVIQYNVKMDVSEGGVNWIQAIVTYILASVCVVCVVLIIYVCWKQKTQNHVGSTSVSDASHEKPKIKAGSCNQENHTN
ncbi:semaphorin-4E-like [Poecilia formosa]|uniref:semaphorin-4E-like n=1 Tax=Poecilia formosa TaxID=48698 RepID=UPI0007B9C096|nr:PREDICTED: semaphorin-4E-like [Poecilia formosa]XP_016520336.1 PREDICTED: semaphorin-4E-like [Poecilia formosa]